MAIEIITLDVDGTPLTLLPGNLENPDALVQYDPDSFTDAAELERWCQSNRVTLTMDVRNYTHFAALDTLMAAGAEHKTRIKYRAAANNQHDYTPCIYTVMPRLALISNVRSVHIALATAGLAISGADSGSWTNLGTMLGANSPTLGLNDDADGIGRPCIDSVNLVDDFIVKGLAAATLNSFRDVEVHVAFLTTTDVYRVYQSVYINDVLHNPARGPQGSRVMVVGESDLWDNLLTHVTGATGASATVEGCVNGYQLQAHAWGETLASLLTISTV